MPSKVLIVDDDAATRSGVAELLREAGYDTRAVGTFEEGLKALRTDMPDLLIADVRLGAFNGLQLLVSSPRPIPAIIITGFADPVLEFGRRRTISVAPVCLANQAFVDEQRHVLLDRRHGHDDRTHRDDDVLDVELALRVSGEKEQQFRRLVRRNACVNECDQAW